MRLRERLNKPEYFFRPTQLVRRLRARLSTLIAPSHSQKTTVTLPWSLDLVVRQDDTIGRSIADLGVYELAVSETIWRLLAAGDTAVDVGANIGYLTGLMARRVGVAGSVYAFEAHPEVFGELMLNVDGWRSGRAVIGNVFPAQLAVATGKGTARLNMGATFGENRGTASIAKQGSASIEVMTDSLDSALSGVGQIGLLKVDVEGAESEVVAGARHLLESRRIRHVVFEEHNEQHSDVADALSGYGYRIFNIGHSFLGPRLTPYSEGPSHRPWEPRNLLATLDAGAATKLLAQRGWRVFDSSAS